MSVVTINGYKANRTLRLGNEFDSVLLRRTEVDGYELRRLGNFDAIESKQTMHKKHEYKKRLILV